MSTYGDARQTVREAFLNGGFSQPLTDAAVCALEQLMEQFFEQKFANLAASSAATQLPK